MKVTITYFDIDSLTVEEVIRRAKHNYGDFVEVDIQPSSSNPKDIIYFGIQRLITHDHLSILFEEPSIYKEKLKELVSGTLLTLSKELSDVVNDNELKST